MRPDLARIVAIAVVVVAGVAAMAVTEAVVAAAAAVMEAVAADGIANHAGNSWKMVNGKIGNRNQIPFAIHHQPQILKTIVNQALFTIHHLPFTIYSRGIYGKADC